MYCRNCGAEIKEKFCPSCGTSAADVPPTATPVSAGMPDNLAAALCYIPLIGGIAMLLLAPNNAKKNVRFNAFQSFLLLLAFWASGIVFAIFDDVSWDLTMVLRNLTRLAFVGISLFCAFKAFNREDFEIPFLGPLARKQA